MTISQVVRFFERHGLSFTKTMIQNYVRVGIIPPPVDKRYYHKKHLILLTMIDSLKGIFSLEEIGYLFRPIMKDVETFDDDIIDMSVVYTKFCSLYEDYITENLVNLPIIVSDTKKRTDENNVSEGDKREAMSFLILLSLMVKTISIKKIVNIIMDNQALEN
jgi:hypothetical protein